MDCSLPGSSVHGIVQAKILGWVSISCSRGSSQPRGWIHVRCRCMLYQLSYQGSPTNPYSDNEHFHHPIKFLFIPPLQPLKQSWFWYFYTLTVKLLKLIHVCSGSDLNQKFCWLVARNSLFPFTEYGDHSQHHGLQHARPPCPSPTPRTYSDPCPLSRWCHPTISSSVVSFFSCLQSFPASGSFPMSQFFISDGQSIRVSTSVSGLLINIQ